jgi:serine/threonine protein kinase
MPSIPRANPLSPTMLGEAARAPAPALQSPSPPPARAEKPSFISSPSLVGPTPSGRGSLSTTSTDTILPKLCPQCGMRYPPEFNVCPKDAAELADAEESDDELIGRVLAETYAIVRVVGEGGMGRVYEARHTRIGGKRFAVKLLHPEYARQPEVLSRFQREAESAASIQSPHVGDVYDVGRTQDGRPFIVAEFLEGRELADFLKDRGRLDVPLAVRIVRQICKALSAAHKLGIVHRDMKPENVFLVGDLSAPTAKVIDFGISKVAESGGQSLTKTGMIMGTPSYMSPEQAKGERVDHRTDVYATGAILYELVTGKRPFDKVDPTATIMSVLLEDPERPCAINPTIPASLEMLIQRAMAKVADARYQSMDELDAELATFVERTATGQSVMPPPGASPARSNTTLGRAAMDTQRDVALSRPTIVVLGSLGVFGVLGVLMSMSAAAIRMSRGGTAISNVTGSEALLLASLLTLALSTPIGFAIYLVRKNVWSNSAKTLALATSLRHGVLAAFLTYGLIALTVRLTETLLMRQAAGVAWPVWDLVGGLVAIVSGIGTFAVMRAEAKR